MWHGYTDSVCYGMMWQKSLDGLKIGEAAASQKSLKSAKCKNFKRINPWLKDDSMTEKQEGLIILISRMHNLNRWISQRK